MIKSLLASLFGIQSRKNQEEDFQRGNPIDFIITGVIGVIILLFTVALVVYWVIQK